jgi:Domain of unknown function (DUF1707)
VSIVSGESLRASDAERDRVVQFLKEHTTQGRLALEELKERTGAAYAATTRLQLHQLTVDLPGAVVFGGDEPATVAADQRPPDRTPAWRIVLACCCVLPRALTAWGLVGGAKLDGSCARRGPYS